MTLMRLLGKHNTAFEDSWLVNWVSKRAESSTGNAANFGVDRVRGPRCGKAADPRGHGNALLVLASQNLIKSNL